MAKPIALTAVVLAFLVVPALASANPTATHITTPANPAFVTFDHGNPGSLHVAGTTSGGTGDVDLRCYFGSSGPLLASQVPVTGGSFSTDVALTETLLDTTLDYPYPYCTLRAVPTGTVPAAPPGAPSPWDGPSIGWSYRYLKTFDQAWGQNPATTLKDYWIAATQSEAMNDFDSAPSCGLCDTYLFQPGTKARANPIWWANSELNLTLAGYQDRTSVKVDGVNTYTSYSAYAQGLNHHLADNLGFPKFSVTNAIDPANGNLTIDEHAPFAKCAENPAVFPPTDASCASFAPSGLELERQFRTSDSGLRVTVVDHWKSVDGKAHELDAFYADTLRSENALTLDHEGRADFTWTNDGMHKYAVPAQIPVPPSAPATMLVKTDNLTPNTGDNMNPFGAMTFGTRPSAVKVLNIGDADQVGRWQTRYQLTVPAGGEATIAIGYSHAFTLASVKEKATMMESALAAPSITIDSPADSSTVDSDTVHVTGTASSPDGQTSVRVNGIDAALAGGQWSAYVPVADGANQITAVASNAIGVTTYASRSVNRVTAPAAPATSADPAPVATAAPVVAAAKPVRCVVPKLRGKTLAKAKSLLKRAHCRLGKVARKASTAVKPGRVIKTRLKAGTRHRAGTRIRVTVAKAH
jgi:hypothetical protein